MYNCLQNEDKLLINAPYTSKEQAAYQARLRLRSQEKTFIVRNIHRLNAKIGEWILANRLSDYHSEMMHCEDRFHSKFKGYKIHLLWKILRSKKPKIVVEYGSGSSTALIAAILDKNQTDFGVQGRLISFEQNPVFYELVQSVLPDRFRDRVLLCQSTLGYERFKDYREIFYHESPAILPQKIDVIFIDGPGAAPEMLESDAPIFSGDLRRLAATRQWGYAFTDIRYFNSQYFVDVMDGCKISEKVNCRTIEVLPER